MNILVTINKSYLRYFLSMINSLCDNNKQEIFVYIVSNDIENYHLKNQNLPKNLSYQIIRFDDNLISGAPTIKWWTKEVYYRLFAKDYLPKNLDRILYLDCDLIVKGDISDFYNTEFNDNYFIGATNIYSSVLKRFLQIKNGASKNSLYINSGVILLNLKLLREKQDTSKIISYVKKRKYLLCCPDQDIINGLYGEKIGLCDGLIYNLSDRAIKRFNKKQDKNINLSWVEDNAKIIHYIGKNKPWKDDYKGILNTYYKRYEQEVKNEERRNLDNS